MVLIRFDEKSYEVREGESVVSCLLRHGVSFPCSCLSGVCQSCLAQMEEGPLDPVWQKGLKDTWIARDYFLPCLAKPEKYIAFTLPTASDILYPAVIKQMFFFKENIVCVQLNVESSIEWLAGQYLNIINSDGLRRSYSIANIPKKDEFIELHIKLIPDGAMSTWWKTKAKPGLEIQVQGPLGNCFYLNLNQAPFPMVLIGTGTGLAPLLGIVKDALYQNHQGVIYLIHGGLNSEDLYRDTFLKEMVSQYSNFIYEGCVFKEDLTQESGDIAQVLLKVLHASDVEKTRVYVCGPEKTTRFLKSKAFLAGVPSAFIYSDAFISSK